MVFNFLIAQTTFVLLHYDFYYQYHTLFYAPNVLLSYLCFTW